jgi:hypothetical protein
VFTPPNVTVRLPRNVYIYSNQPPGDYILRAAVEPLDSSIQPATASDNFVVTEQNETQEEPEVVEEVDEETRQIPRPGADQPEEPDISNVTIVDAPQTFNLVRGRPTVKSVTVANTGDLRLANISLDVIGIPPSWVSVNPSEIQRLSREETEVFAVTLEPPADAPLQSYNGTLLAVAAEDTGEQEVSVAVFKSLEEKIRADIGRLRERVTQLRTRADTLEDRGIDVSGVRSIITEIEARISDAETRLDEGDPQDAVQDIEEADSLVRDADQTLQKLRQPGRREAFTLLPTAIGLLVLLAALLAAIYLLKVRHVHPFEDARERIHDVAVQMKKRKMEEKQELQEEKQKTKRLIRLLEAQHEEGIMGDESYEELRSSAEEKLRRVNRKLEED